jgi:hypothetical protein
MKDFESICRKQAKLTAAYSAKRKELSDQLVNLLKQMHGTKMNPTTKDLGPVPNELQKIIKGLIVADKETIETLKSDNDKLRQLVKLAFVAGCDTEANCATQDMRGEEQYVEWFYRWFAKQMQSLPAHPDQTSPMTVGPEEFMEPKPPIGYDVILDITRRAMMLLTSGQDNAAKTYYAFLQQLEFAYPAATKLINERYPPKT